METNGRENLRAPLLQPSEIVSSTTNGSGLKSGKKTSKVVFRIRGIKCASCAVSIESVVGNMGGIESISVSPLQGQGVVKYRPDLTNNGRMLSSRMAGCLWSRECWLTIEVLWAYRYGWNNATPLCQIICVVLNWISIGWHRLAWSWHEIDTDYL